MKVRTAKLTLSRVMQYLYIYALTMIVLLPVLNIFISSVKTNTEINRSNFFPSVLNFVNFTKVLGKEIFYTGMMNTIIISFFTLLISTFISALAAYPLSRHKGKIYTAIYFFFLSAMMVPHVSNMVPLYALLRSFNLINSRIGMILLYSSRVSMGILLFTSFIKTIPLELEEAALLDGCGYFRAFFNIIFPMLKPVSVSYVMVNILTIWNDFLLPQLFLSKRSKQTITLAVYTFRNESGSDWGAIFALMTLVVLIPMVVFLTNQKYFYEGMAVGAVKG